MASVDRTAYPRFKRNISVRELREAYTPSLEKMDWARGLTGTDEALLSVVLWLKCCQRLGYFPRLDRIPVTVTGHVRQELGLHEATAVTCVPERTTRNHKGLVRHRLGLSADQGAARKFACEAIRAAAQTKDNPADLVNIALEKLVKNSCELPAFPTVDRLAGEIGAQVNQDFQHAAHGLMTAEEQGRMLGLLRVDPLTRRSGHDQLKQIAPRATISRLRRHLDHLAWLDGRDTIADPLVDEAGWLRQCSGWLTRLNADDCRPAVNLRPGGDHPKRALVATDLPMPAAILDRIAAGIDELARARRVQDLDTAAVLPDPGVDLTPSTGGDRGSTRRTSSTYTRLANTSRGVRRAHRLSCCTDRLRPPSPGLSDRRMPDDREDRAPDCGPR